MKDIDPIQIVPESINKQLALRLDELTVRIMQDHPDNQPKQRRLKLVLAGNDPNEACRLIDVESGEEIAGVIGFEVRANADEMVGVKIEFHCEFGSGLMVQADTEIDIDNPTSQNPSNT